MRPFRSLAPLLLVCLAGFFIVCNDAEAQTNLALTATATDNGGGAAPTYGATKVNDGSTTTYQWISTSGNPDTTSYIQLWWSTAQTVRSFTLHLRRLYFNGRLLDSGTIQYHNGSSWVNEMSWPSQNHAQIYCFNLSQARTTQGLRITNMVTVGEGTSPQTSNPWIGEWQVWGTTVPNPNPTLTVNSARGSPTPAVGTSTYSHNTTVSASVSSPVAGATGTRYVCTGWTGWNSVWAPGSGTSVNIILTVNSTITWNWQTEYQLTLATNPSGGGTITGATSGSWHVSGSSVTLTATPNVGSTFSSWSGGITSTSNPVTFNMTGPMTVTANFQTATANLTVASAQGSPTPAVGSHSYSPGTSVNCSVTSPVAGGAGTRYVCTGWTGTGSVPATGTGTSTTFTINVNSSITWNWQTQYQVITAVNPAAGGAVTPNPAGPWYPAGSSLTVTANPNSGYLFNNWTGLLTTTNNPDTFNVVSAGTVTANFIAATWNLTVTSAQGSPNPAVGSHTYNHNSSVTATVTSPVAAGAGTQYVCTGWTGTGDVPATGTSTSVTFTMTQNSTITWNWQTEYQLTTAVNPAGSGTVTPTPAGPWIVAGTVVSLQAAPNTGYNFANWSGAVSGTNNPETFTMNAPATATANFTPIGPSLTVTSAQGSPTPPVGSQAYTTGSSVTASVTSPVPGAAGIRYVCTGWTGTVDVPASGTSTSVTFTINNNSTITWNWVTEYQLTSSANPAAGGTVTPTPAGPWFASGSTVSLSASANAGYTFFGWSGNLTGTANPGTLLMDGPKTVSGNFLGALSLLLTPGPSNPGASIDSGTAAGIPMLHLSLTAGTGEAVSVSSIGISVTGASDESATASANLFVDVNSNGIYDFGTDTAVGTGVAFPSNEGTALFTPAPALNIPVSTTIHLLVTFDLAASAGDDFKAMVSNGTDVTAAGAVSTTPITPLGTPVEGGVKTVAAPGTPGSVEIRLGLNHPSDGNANPGETGVSAMQFTLRASSLEGANVTSLSFTAAGSGNDLTGIGDARLYVDVNGDGEYDAGDMQIGTSQAYGADNGTLSFTGFSENIGAGTQVTWLLVYDMSSTAEGTFQGFISLAGDVGATGAVSSAAMTVTGAPLTGRTITVMQTAADPAYFMGGCAGGVSSPGGWAGWLLLALAGILALRRKAAGAPN